MRERQRVAHPAGRGEHLGRDQPEKHDRQDEQHGDERRGARLARERADQRAKSTERGAGQREPGRKERQASPRLAARGVADHDHGGERERDAEPEHGGDDAGERDLRGDEPPRRNEAARQAAEHVFVPLTGERTGREHEGQERDRQPSA